MSSTLWPKGQFLIQNRILYPEYWKFRKKKTCRAIYRNEKKNDYAWHWLTVCVVQSFCFSTMFGIVVDEHVIGHSQKISLHTRSIWGYDHLKYSNFKIIPQFFSHFIATKILKKSCEIVMNTEDGSTEALLQILYGQYLILGVFRSCMF